MAIKQFSQVDLRVAPTQDTHLVRWCDLTEYVNALTASVCRVVLTDNFDGVYNASAKTLTENVTADLEIDGVDDLAIGERVLLVGQTDRTQNGVYVVTVVGEDGMVETVLTRADDFNVSASFKNNMMFPVAEGDMNADSRWKLTVDSIPFVLDTSGMEFNRDVVDLTKIIEFSVLIEGDDTIKVYDLTHSLGTFEILHELYDLDGDTVVTEFRRVDADTVRLSFGVPLGVGNDLVLVLHAEVEPL